MARSLAVPEYVKYRRESGFGLVYHHENYGSEDASLARVDDLVLDVLTYVDGQAPTAEAVRAEFSPATVDSLLDAGYLVHA